MNKRYKINRGRNVTLKMGTGHPGYIFALDEIGGETKEETVKEWIKGGFVEDLKPEKKAVPKPKTATVSKKKRSAVEKVEIKKEAAEKPEKPESAPEIKTEKQEEPKRETAKQKTKRGRPSGGAKRK